MIRSANPKDLPQILSLIHQLAVYEKEPNAVKTTEQDLLRDGFGEDPYFHILVYEQDSIILGFALYFFTWSTWEGRPSLYLEDLFVKEDSRGQGVGAALFKGLARQALSQNCARFEWAVLDWNQPARDFYHQKGARHMDGWLPYRLDGHALKDFARS